MGTDREGLESGGEKGIKEGKGTEKDHDETEP